MLSGNMESKTKSKTSINKEELRAMGKTSNYHVLHLCETSSLRITNEMRNAIRTFDNGDSVRIKCVRSSNEHDSYVTFAIEREPYAHDSDWQPGLIVTITNGWSPLSSHFSKIAISTQRKAGNFEGIPSFGAKRGEVYIERQTTSNVYGGFVEESTKKTYGIELLSVLHDALSKLQGKIIHELESRMTISEHERKENEIITLQYLVEMIKDIQRTGTIAKNASVAQSETVLRK